jgi:hypothetical protein
MNIETICALVSEFVYSRSSANLELNLASLIPGGVGPATVKGL